MGCKAGRFAAYAVLCMFAAAPARASSVLPLQAMTPYQSFVAEAAQRFAMPADWIAAVIHVESHGEAQAVSAKGAMGLMQVMPETWQDLRSRYGFGADPLDPHDNILAGTAYLRLLYDRYGASGFLAAYNAGPARYDAYRLGNSPLAAETRDYLARLGALVPDLAGPDPVYPVMAAGKPPGDGQDDRLRALVAAITIVAALAPRNRAPDDTGDR